MAITHFTVRTPQRDGPDIRFVGQHRDGGATGPVVSEQTYRVPAQATAPALQAEMAAAVRRDLDRSTKVATSVALVPDGTTIALADTPLTPTQLLTQDLEQKLRRHRAAQTAVAEGALLVSDNQVTTRKTEFVAAFEALRAATNLNTALDLLL